MIKFFGGFALLLLLAGFLWFTKTPGGNIGNITFSQENPSSTPFLFQELTIPYLRGREYNGEIIDIRKISENSYYTSHIATYESDGLRLQGLLNIPKGEEPDSGWPAVVFIHGYIAPTIYRTTERYVSHVDYLARNGFVVFKIDLRGHGDSEGEAGGAYYSSDYIIDTLNAYNSLQKSDFVDPRKIGLWGHSMAGNVVFRSLTIKKDIPAAVIWAGAGYTYSDLTEFRINDQSYRPPVQQSERARKRKLLNDTYGTFDPANWFWKLVPPTNFLEGVSSNLQIHHAVDDDVVSVEYSRNLQKVLEGSGINLEFEEHPAGGHNLTGHHFNDAIGDNVNFYKKIFD